MKKLVLATLALATLSACVTNGAPHDTRPTLDPVASAMVRDLLSFRLDPAVPDTSPPSVPNPQLPTPPPELAQEGTPWLDYLAWGIDASQAQIDLLGVITERGRAQDGIDLTNAQLGWLAGHPPQQCYRALHTEHQVMLDTVLLAYRAVKDLSGDAVQKLQAATDEIAQMTAMFDSVECI